VGPAQVVVARMLTVLKFRSGLRLTLDDHTPVKIECFLCEHVTSGPLRESVEAHNTHCRAAHTVEELDALKPAIEVQR
jgi:hypothetical protein